MRTGFFISMKDFFSKHNPTVKGITLAFLSGVKIPGKTF